MTRKLNLGIVGAGGAVGKELLRLMAEESFPVDALKLFGAGDSAGDVHTYEGGHHVIRPFVNPDLRDLDVVVVATPPDQAHDVLRHIASQGVLSIDTSSASRLLPDVPLAAPAVDRRALADHTGAIATPNGLVPPLALVLTRLGELAEILTVESTALLSAAARGRSGITALSQQVVAVLNQQPLRPDIFSRPIAFNLVPGWDSQASCDSTRPNISPDGPTLSEELVLRELSRVLPGLPAEVGLTLAFAPVFCGTVLFTAVRLERRVSLEALRRIFSTTPGMVMWEGEEFDTLPGSIDAIEQSDILLSRLRVGGDTVRLCLTFDNLRLAARNLILTLEALRDDELV